ncbi:hypothetical protein D9615_007394 [Tricholomella constricta]|uniref:Uncharacterized protein n=1 Tax=Tricholomella constricta TaxID=117010 RepID=A0A8H5GYF7_9AGAR|nr:hypothetical protein D9615_007394 [Tricholomella constricta]
MSSPYLPHAIYSVAIISISIHLVNQRKLVSDERARIAAQTSILESISEQLRSDKPLSATELDRLKGLARPMEHNPAVEGMPGESIGWREVFLGNKKEDGMSKWEKRDVEKMNQDMEK